MRPRHHLIYIFEFAMFLLLTFFALAQDAEPTAEPVEQGVLPVAGAAADSPVAAQIDTIRFAKNFAILLKASYPHSIWDQVRDGFTSAFIIGFVTLFAAIALTVAVCWLMIRFKLLWTGERFPRVVTALWVVTISAAVLLGSINVGLAWYGRANWDRILVEEKLAESAVASVVMACMCEQNEVTLTDASEATNLDDMLEKGEAARQALVDAVPTAVDDWAEDKGRTGAVLRRIAEIKVVREYVAKAVEEENPWGFYMALFAMKAATDDAPEVNTEEALLISTGLFFNDMNKALLAFSKSMLVANLVWTAAFLAIALGLVAAQKPIGRGLAATWRRIIGRSTDPTDPSDSADPPEQHSVA
jgi:hypothetical protein